jgi:hypothetical protein
MWFARLSKCLSIGNTALHWRWRTCNHALCNMFAPFSECTGCWRDFVTTLCNQEHTGVEVPNELITHILEPMITRWWTLGECSRFLVTNWAIIEKIARAAVNISNTVEAKNKMSSGLLSIMKQSSIHANVAFLSAFATKFLNKHFLWCQQSEQNAGKAGFLPFHRQVRCFQMRTGLKHLLENWETERAFKPFVDLLKTLPDVLTTEEPVSKSVKRKMVKGFLKLSLEQAIKHNRRQMDTNKLVPACIAEQETGHIVSRLIVGGGFFEESREMLRREEGITNGEFTSAVHRAKIDLEEWTSFLEANTKKNIDAIRRDGRVAEHQAVIGLMADGMDVWDTSDPATAEHRQRVLPLQAQSSTNHNMERNVKIAGWMTFTRKNELIGSACAMASNDFIIENKAQSQIDEAEDDEDAVESRTARVRGERFGQKRALHLANAVSKNARECCDIAMTMEPQ